MQIGSLFAGIGGFDLAARWMGWRTKWYSEIDPYACRVMEARFGNVADAKCGELRQQSESRRSNSAKPRNDGANGQMADTSRRDTGNPYNVGDIREWTPTVRDAVDIVCGGFPCQPVSLAGQRKAQEDERWLWPEFARVLGILRPRYVVIENVPGLRSRGMGDVLRDLSQIGYDAEWTSLSAADVGAPHKRERVWIVAYPNAGRELQPQGRVTDKRGRVGEVADTKRGRLSGGILGCSGTEAIVSTENRGPGGGDCADWRTNDEGWWDVEPNVGRVAHGVPSRVDRLKCLGNAIVPQCALEIFRCL